MSPKGVRVALATVITATVMPLSAESATAIAPTTSRTYVFTVLAKASPALSELDCASVRASWPKARFPGGTLCLTPTAFAWTGSVDDAAAHLSGKLAGSCTAEGDAEGYESDSPGAKVDTIARTLVEQADATAHCLLTITFPLGSISGTATITSTLRAGRTTGTSTESAKLVIRAGTGMFANHTGGGEGKLVTQVPPTTFTWSTNYDGPGPLIARIPAIDTQAESWRLTF